MSIWSKLFGKKSGGGLVSELIQIGRTDGYLSMTPGGKFDEHFNNLRAREIGEALNQKGGFERMLAAHDKVREALGPVKARELESAWHRIGRWQR